VTVSRAWLSGIRTSWRGRAAVAAAVGAVALAAAVPAAMAGTPAAGAAAAAPRVIATTDVGADTTALAVNPRTGTIYVLNTYNNFEERVAVISPKTNKITATISFRGTSTSPMDLGVSPVNGDFYLTNAQANGRTSVVVINGDKVRATVGVPRYGSVLTVSPLTGDVYVGDYANVVVISGRTSKVVATVTASNNTLLPAAVSPITGRVYVADGGCTHESVCTGTVTVLSGQTNKIIGSDTFDSVPGQISVGPKTGDVYVSTGDVSVTGANSEAIAVISGQANKIIDSIAFPACVPAALSQAGRFAISPRTGNLYVPIDSGNGCRTYSAQVVSGQTNHIINALRLATPGEQMAVSPATGDIYLLRPENAENDTFPSLLEVIAD